jgi:hypothetical protein
MDKEMGFTARRFKRAEEKNPYKDVFLAMAIRGFGRKRRAPLVNSSCGWKAAGRVIPGHVRSAGARRPKSARKTQGQAALPALQRTVARSI